MGSESVAALADLSMYVSELKQGWKTFSESKHMHSQTGITNLRNDGIYGNLIRFQELNEGRPSRPNERRTTSVLEPVVRMQPHGIEW